MGCVAGENDEINSTNINTLRTASPSCFHSFFYILPYFCEYSKRNCRKIKTEPTKEARYGKTSCFEKEFADSYFFNFKFHFFDFFNIPF